MTAVCAIIVLICGAVAMVVGEGIDRLHAKRRHVLRVHRATQRADAHNEQDYRAARRAMNEAARQSWRNQFE